MKKSLFQENYFYFAHGYMNIFHAVVNMLKSDATKATDGKANSQLEV